jgi:hypothetical protein
VPRGLKVTVRSQEAPAATLTPQVLPVRENTLGFAPVTVMLVMLKSEFPVLVTVEVKDLVRDVFTLPKLKSAGTTLTVPVLSVTLALADFVGSVTEVAVTATSAGVGAAAGAVYLVDTPFNVLLTERVPHVEAGHAEGGVPCVRVQVTPALTGSFSNVGVKSSVIFTGRMAEIGETETTMASTVIVTAPDCVASDIEVAVMVTDKFAAGGVDGAVYVTDVPVLLLRVPAPGVGEVIAQDAGFTP